MIIKCLSRRDKNPEGKTSFFTYEIKLGRRKIIFKPLPLRMPSAFSHALSSVALGCAFKNNIDKSKILFIGAICSIIPDVDVISFQFGISYSSMWGHRGITHSFFFSAFLAVLVLFIFFRQTNMRSKLPQLFIYFFLSTALHPLLDACTDAPRAPSIAATAGRR